MKNVSALCLLFLAAGATCVSQEATATTGTFLQQACMLEEKSYEIGYIPKPQDAMGAGYCLGYISGLLESEDNGTRFCTPHPYLVKQMVDVILNYSKEHPEKLKEHRHSLSVQALSDSFPCRSTNVK